MVSRAEAIRIVWAALEDYVDNCLSGEEYAPEVKELSEAWNLLVTEESIEVVSVDEQTGKVELQLDEEARVMLMNVGFNQVLRDAMEKDSP